MALCHTSEGNFAAIRILLVSKLVLRDMQKKQSRTRGALGYPLRLLSLDYNMTSQHPSDSRPWLMCHTDVCESTAPFVSYRATEEPERGPKLYQLATGVNRVHQKKNQV